MCSVRCCSEAIRRRYHQADDRRFYENFNWKCRAQGVKVSRFYVPPEFPEPKNTSIRFAQTKDWQVCRKKVSTGKKGKKRKIPGKGKRTKCDTCDNDPSLGDTQAPVIASVFKL